VSMDLEIDGVVTRERLDQALNELGFICHWADGLGGMRLKWDVNDYEAYARHLEQEQGVSAANAFRSTVEPESGRFVRYLDCQFVHEDGRFTFTKYAFYDDLDMGRRIAEELNARVVCVADESFENQINQLLVVDDSIQKNDNVGLDQTLETARNDRVDRSTQRATGARGRQFHARFWSGNPTKRLRTWRRRSGSANIRRFP